MTFAIPQTELSGVVVDWENMRGQVGEFFDQAWKNLPESCRRLFEKAGVSLNRLKAFVQRNWTNGNIRKLCYALLQSAAVNVFVLIISYLLGLGPIGIFLLSVAVGAIVLVPQLSNGRWCARCGYAN